MFQVNADRYGGVHLLGLCMPRYSRGHGHGHGLPHAVRKHTHIVLLCIYAPLLCFASIVVANEQHLLNAAMRRSKPGGCIISAHADTG
jgi:hypothetical protein